MSIQGFAAVPNWLVRSDEFTLHDKIVYLVLASHVTRDDSWFMSHADIAKEAGIGVTSVKSALNRLREAGLVSWIGRVDTETGARLGNSYRVYSTLDPLVATRPGPSRHTATPPSPGGEQKKNPEEEPKESSGAVAPRTTQTLIAEWIDHCQTKPPKQVVGQLSRTVKQLLDEGYEYDVVRTAVMAWHRRGLHPSTLPSVLNEIVNPPTRTQPKTFGQLEEERVAALFNRYQEEERNAEVRDAEDRHVRQLGRGAEGHRTAGRGVARGDRRPGLRGDDGEGEEPLPF